MIYTVYLTFYIMTLYILIVQLDYNYLPSLFFSRENKGKTATKL